MSPTMTVVVLAVLWLIVVVPMIMRRKDEKARERSVSSFGKAMRALSRTASSVPVSASVSASRNSVRAGVSAGRSLLSSRSGATVTINTEPDVFVTGAGHVTPAEPIAPEVPVATRRPVRTAEEALMYPVDRGEMSAARQQMMARRRRSLTILGVGSAVTLLLGVIVGGAIWLLTLCFVGGLGGYVWFLRAQAIRDRERRAGRLQRAQERAGLEEAEIEYVEESFEDEFADTTVVQIDDDDISLHNMDTVDLTGLYTQDGFHDEHLQRRAG